MAWVGCLIVGLVIGMLIGIRIGDYYWLVQRPCLSLHIEGHKLGWQAHPHRPPLLTRLLKPPLLNPPLREARPAFLDIRRALRPAFFFPPLLRAVLR